MDPSRRSIVAVVIPSDDENDVSPLPANVEEPSPQLPSPAGTQEVLVLDEDDATPIKMPIQLGGTPLVVSETPASPSSDPIALVSDPSIVRCTFACSRLNPPRRQSHNFSGTSRLICLETDDDSDEETPTDSSNAEKRFARDEFNIGSSYGEDATRIETVEDRCGTSASEDAKGIHVEPKVNRDIQNKKKKSRRIAASSANNDVKDKDIGRKNQTKEEKRLLNEERKRKRQEEKLQRESLKVEAAQLKKLHKERVKWEKGKFALKSITAEIDVKVIESGAVGGHLLTRFSEKGLNFRITTNPIQKSIFWKMHIPDEISQLSMMGTEVPYLLLVYEAEEFCNLVSSGSLLDNVHDIQRRFPSFTICFITNKLMSYVNKREQSHFKNGSDVSGWKRPPIEEVLSKLSTNFTRVHSRHCMDEADMAEHVAGLTSSLATCRFRKKLTWLSLNANGSLVPKDFIDRNLIKKSAWLKALVAIPKVHPRLAVAISKKYPTMRSLLKVYMDSNKSVHEKEFLLNDLIVEGEPGQEDRRLGGACSKRIYRILMAKNGVNLTDDVEDGADSFRS